MEIITGTTKYSMKKDTVVAIGKFDGIHVGHQSILKAMLKYKEWDYQTVVFTFDKPPASLLGREAQKDLSTKEEKRDAFCKKGMDYVIEFPFTEETCKIEPEDFIRTILKEQLMAKAVVAGPDLRFGYKGRGDEEMLKEEGARLGIEVAVLPKATYNGKEISSTYVRKEVEEGNMDVVRELLGEPYSVYGKVVHGNHLGHKIGMPTVNMIPPSNKLLPKSGVYLSKTICCGQVYNSISNIGYKPTVSEERQIGLETHIYDFQKDIYEENVKVLLLKHMRDEKKFSGVEELKEVLERDKEEGRKMHGI
ncbi:bifunctional riboflavin kinase/FAD synthetase [bacterium 1XD42-8]|jgi:riboflavin kinase/FMN adenylyltransferase|nr:bifunctional riboflavin kinase/FAD synthetase [Lachnospiraceae bacterium]RKJ48312.1 bifunctional riboflavin kinase/FAD synthetase [bacterium 1XD42-8]